MMYDKSDLFSSVPPPVRSTDWWTAHVAAKRIMPHLGELQREVLELIREAGE